MNKIENIEELHKILLDIAKYFHQICVDNDIPYYMLGGTMLGAVRHKGFIPWDDDMDFGIPRIYFNHFIEVAEHKFSSKYSLMTIDNSDRIHTNLVKIYDTRTIIREKHYKKTNVQLGVNIDVFPLDYADENMNLFSKNKMISFLIKLQGYRFYPIGRRSLPKKILAFIVKILLYPLRRKTIVNLIEKFLIEKEGVNIANHYGAWGIKENVPKKYFGVPKLYSFENVSFYGVEDYDNYLKSLYHDWRVLPPLEKRKHHIHDAFYIESE